MSSRIFDKKAVEIIKESIKSAIYIDEKGWNPFETEFNSEIEEHIISKDLYANFKRNGIALNIHQFKIGQEDLPLDNDLKKYLFNKKDLVLLDWDLDERETDDNKLNIPALKLLRDIINQSQIHFCAIYSSSPDFDDIIKKIFSYFSGTSQEDYDGIRLLIEHNDEIINLLRGVDIISPSIHLIAQIRQLDNTVLRNTQIITGNKFPDCVKDLAISINPDLPKANQRIPCNIELMSLIDNEYTLMINNTVITILRKTDNRPKIFIRNFSRHISNDRSKSFFKLLGLNMQNEFAKKGAFVDTGILNIKFNTFLYHRKQINSDLNKSPFQDFIKEVLLENAKMNLNSSELSILNSDFLDNFKYVRKHLDETDIAAINSFYNGIKLNSNKNIDFGDVFKDEANNYFLCITALCDCAHPENTQNRFYFVKNSGLVEIKKAINLGDTGFISYLNKDLCISWSTKENFIKPIQYYIPNNELNNGTILVMDWRQGGAINLNLTYVFTLKQNYAQRISNHAFSHPIRVGVNFVKI